MHRFSFLSLKQCVGDINEGLNVYNIYSTLFFVEAYNNSNNDNNNNHFYHPTTDDARHDCQRWCPQWVWTPLTTASGGAHSEYEDQR